MSKDPLRCPVCGEVAQRRAPNPKGTHWVWTHRKGATEEGIPKSIVHTMSKEDYD